MNDQSRTEMSQEIEIAPGVRLVLEDENTCLLHTQAVLPPGRYYATLRCSFSSTGYPLGTVETEAQLRILVRADGGANPQEKTGSGSEKSLVQIEYFFGKDGLYDTEYGPLLVVDHELTHEEAISHFNFPGDWEVVGVHNIDTDPMISIRCPHCGARDSGAVSEYLWQTTDQGVLLACCPTCNEKISAEEILRENQ